jgi:uncharacterized phage-associated protein
MVGPKSQPTDIIGIMAFNQQKATQAAAYFLARRGGRMSYLKLIKLLYLADRAALLRWGRPITTDRYVSMDKGPVVSRILDLATEDPVPGQEHFWNEHISEPSNYEISLKKDPGRDEISDAEVGLLEEVFGEHGGKSRWELVELTHKLPEWKDPKGSAISIEVRDILRLAGKTELETKAVEEELSAVAFADSIFRS